MYLLDTDVVLKMFRDNIPIEGLNEEGYISALTFIELFSFRNTRDSGIHMALINFLSNFTPIPITPEIAIRAGELMRDYNLKIGTAIISATAIIYGLTLVTTNPRPFAPLRRYLNITTLSKCE